MKRTTNIPRYLVIAIFSLILTPIHLFAQNDWLQGWRDATVAIGVIDTAKAIDRNTKKYLVNAKGDTSKIPYFRVVGTGMIFANPDTTVRTPLLLTAKHVFHDLKKHWNPASLRIRFSWFSDKSVINYLGIAISLKNPKGSPLWFSHPDSTVDLAVIPLDISIQDAGRSSIVPIRIQDSANEDEAFEGASVLLMGYPGAVGRDYWTKPLLRHGVIAHVDLLSFGKTPFLIDAMIFPGNSGGPVFVVPSGMAKNGSFKVGGRSAFLGVVSAAAIQTVQVEKTAFEFEEAKTDSTEGHFKSFDYMGIGIIEPANRVKELLKSLIP